MGWRVRLIELVAALGMVLSLSAGPGTARAAAEPSGPEIVSSSVLRVSGMTFVGSRGSTREVVLRSRTALFRPDQRIAELREVNALVTEEDQGRSFSMTCERAELNVDTNDFSAEGNVQGETGEGQRYWAPWVRYNHEEGILFTDAPVRMVDSTGSFRGDGFRYHLRERRFQLLGHVRVEQLP